ncbi:MAG: hypothetical protein U1G07_23485 [Verrucomicrobiota bacterium]
MIDSNGRDASLPLNWGRVVTFTMSNPEIGVDSPRSEESRDRLSKASRLGLWSLGCILNAFSVFVFMLLWSSTREFWDLGVLMSFFFCLPLLVVSIVIASVLFWIVHRVLTGRDASLKAQRVLLLTPWLLVAGIWLTAGICNSTSKSRFRSMVSNPIPPSVRDINAAGLNSFLARRWLFEFRMDAKDVDRLVRRHALTRTEAFGFDNVIARDMFLVRVEWARKISCPTNAWFFSKVDPGVPSRWTYFAVETNSSRAWFLEGFQN